MHNSRAAIVVDISKRFMELLGQSEPQWKPGYLRFRLDPAHCGCTASYDMLSDVLLLDANENHQFFPHISEQGRKFLHDLGKTYGIFILVANSSSKYSFYFEFEDLDPWTISKTDGATCVHADPLG